MVTQRPLILVGIPLCLLLLFLGCAGSDNAKQIIGVWEDTKDADRIYEFRKGGKYLTTRKGQFTLEGTFKITGDDLSLTSGDMTQTVKIKKLTEQEMVFQINDKDKTENQLKRVK